MKSPNPDHLTLMDFVQILSGECIYQEMEILKILSLYHVWFRNYDHLKYGPFGLDTKPLKFLSFWNCFYSAIFNRKHLKFGLIIYFHKMIPKTMCLDQDFIKHVFGGAGAKIIKVIASMFFLPFSENYKLTRQNLNVLELIVVILYQEFFR